ncbi:MAG: ADP-ribosylglycohydrolase family protein [Rhodothalassiaceae bacterium]
MLLAAMMAAAMCNTSKEVAFGDWFCRSAESTLASAPGNAAARRRLKNAFDAAKRFGKANSGLGEKEFVEKLKRELYDRHMAAGPDHQRNGFENFDPLLFLKQMAAVASYAGRDMRKALRILAAGPGDADTVPSFLGSIMGAWCGAKRLKADDSGLSADLAAVADCIRRLYGVAIDRIADCLVDLADKHGCCRKSGGR